MKLVPEVGRVYKWCVGIGDPMYLILSVTHLPDRPRTSATNPEVTNYWECLAVCIGQDSDWDWYTSEPKNVYFDHLRRDDPWELVY